MSTTSSLDVPILMEKINSRGMTSKDANELIKFIPGHPDIPIYYTNMLLLGSSYWCPAGDGFEIDQPIELIGGMRANAIVCGQKFSLVWISVPLVQGVGIFAKIRTDQITKFYTILTMQCLAECTIRKMVLYPMCEDLQQASISMVRTLEQELELKKWFSTPTTEKMVSDLLIRLKLNPEEFL